MSKITITHSELINLMYDVAKRAANEVLISTGQIKKTMTRSEAIRLYGRRTFEKSKKFVRWFKTGDKKNSQVVCKREDFDKFITEMPETQKPILYETR